MNTEFSYEYRDADNFKKDETVIIAGELSAKDVEPFLFESEFFVPSEVGLSDLQNEPFAPYDHIWHTILDISPTSDESTCGLIAQDLVSQFKFAFAHEWNQGDVFKRKGLV